MRPIRSTLLLLALTSLSLPAAAEDPKPRPKPAQQTTAPAVRPAPTPVRPSAPAAAPAPTPSYGPSASPSVAPSRPAYTPTPRPAYTAPPRPAGAASGAPSRVATPLPTYAPSAAPASRPPAAARPTEPARAPATVAPTARPVEPKVIDLRPSTAPAAVRPDAAPSGAARPTDTLRRSPADASLTDRTPSTRPIGQAARPRTPSDAPIERPRGVVRPYEGAGDAPPPWQSTDPRTGRPHPRYVSPPPYAPYAPPGYYWYRPWYTSWYCHPYWRSVYPTYSVVYFGFDVSPWDPWWVPPHRYGWTWVPGYWYWGSWVPGYWAPLRPAPVHYVYVPGNWSDTTYVEGHYRRDTRPGWDWVEGYYLDDGTWVSGSWRPTDPGPDGYTWEPGFWNGEDWVDGFWRPEFRSDYTWVSSFYDADGLYHAGYWLPLEDNPGKSWIPGWFDGRRWVEGYWVEASALDDDAIDAWQPPEGVDAGWDAGDVPTVKTPDGLPLALPVDAEE